MEFGEMKRNTTNWSNFCMLLGYVARVWQHQLGFLVHLSLLDRLLYVYVI